MVIMLMVWMMWMKDGLQFQFLDMDEDEVLFKSIRQG